MKTCVYKINRIDGLSYIGITIDFKKRSRDHKRSKKFSIGIKDIEILAECGTYEEAEILEEKFIFQYDAFHNGLNKSLNGKGNHLSSKFTTRGYKFSDESRKKMSENNWSKRDFAAPMLNKHHSEENKDKWSKIEKVLPGEKEKCP